MEKDTMIAITNEEAESISPDESTTDYTFPDENSTEIGTEKLLEKPIQTERNVNGDYYSQNECEQILVPNAAVFQKTVEIIAKKPNGISSKLGSITSLKSIEKIQNVSCRTVLWYVTFFGFIVNYMLRINMNIAIVEMVIVPQKASNHAAACFHAVNETVNSTLATVNDEVAVSSTTTTFAWNELDQSRVLGSFFWLLWTFQVLGGIFGARYGSKLVFGLSNFLACSVCFFIPMAAKMHVNYLIALRVLQGLISGPSWPAMHHLAAQWIPPNERSKFVTAYLGSSIGIAVFYPIFGFILSYWSWESVFYISGVIGVVWYMAWLYLVYDTPDSHPRIDPAEREYIKKSLSNSVHSGKLETPWKDILQSKPIYINIIGQFGGIWGLFTMMTQGPTYFRIIHGWNVQMTGLLNGVPHLCRMIFAFFFSTFVDSLLKNKTLSRTNVRKLAGGTSTILTGIFVLGLAYSGCNSIAAIVFLILATSVHGAVSSGQLASLIDISPNFSGITLGLNGMLAAWPGFISPYIVGKLTHGNQSIQQWQYVFLICAAVLFMSGGVYVLFADSTQQSWNQPKTITKSTREKDMTDINDTKKTSDNHLVA